MVKKNIFLFLMLGLFLISFASALDFDNWKFKRDVTFDGINILENKLLERYNPIEIKNMFGIGSTLAEIYLSQHDDICGERCLSTLEIKLHKDSVMFDSFWFETLQKDGSWIRQNIRNYKLSYWGIVEDFEKQCEVIGKEINGTDRKNCEIVKYGEHYDWVVFHVGDEFKNGIYTIKIEGWKKPSRTVDFKFETHGIVINELAIWGNISSGDDAEVTLNSPEDNFITLQPTVQFNCSANVTGGSSLTNMSLYTNESGIWEIKNTTDLVVNFSLDNIVAYWDLDDDLFDTLGVHNLTTHAVGFGPAVINNGLTSGWADIANADDFDFGTGEFTVSFWFKTTFAADGGLFAMSQGSPVNQWYLQSKNPNSSVQFRRDNILIIESDNGLDSGWHHLVLTRDGSDNLKIYTDGTLDNTVSSFTQNLSTSARVEVNARAGGQVEGVNDMDEVMVMKGRSLNNSEVTTLYNNDNGLNPFTGGSLNFSTQTWNRTITESTLWNCEACDSDGVCGFAPLNRTVLTDVTPPQINAESPIGTLDYNFVGGNETLNVTFTDIGLESCWYNYNGTNITIDGCLTGVKNSTNFILEEDNFNITIYANDSVGNLNSTFIEWEYILLEINRTFDENITEAQTNDFSILVNITEGSSLDSAIFSYNETNHTTTIIFSSGLYLISSSIISPSIDTNTNLSFNFFITIDGITYTTVSNNQTVLNSLFDICGGVSNDTLLNMSLLDEGTRLNISGDIEISANIVSKSSGTSVGTINKTFENVESGAICFSPVSSYNLYNLFVEIRYSSEGYASEFYHIQKADMGEYPKNLSLFDLNSNDSTEFSVTYKNNAFIFVEGAVLQLQRKYIGQDIFEVVEAPVTGDGGKAILHIDLNTNKYRASVVKDGELLDFFENIVFNCDNELSGDCTHSLDGAVDPNNDIPIEKITDFTYSVSVDEDNQTITVLFAVPSGTPSSVSVILNQIDMFGNLTSCNTTVVTSAGSITCDYTDSIDKNILELTISKNDVQLAIFSYINDPELDMDGMNFFIIFLFMISLVGMSISSPEWMLIISVMVLMISGMLLLVSGMSLVMGLGAIAWLVVAVAIIIMKMAKQEDR